MQFANTSWSLLLLVWASPCLFAQKAPMKFGKIDLADLQMTGCAFEPGAAALVLCDYGEADFFFQNGDGFAFRLVHHKRVKIFTKNGLDQANVSLTFYAGKSGDFEKIKSVKAACYYLENGEMKTVELAPKKEVFTTELDRGYRQLKFAIPGAREGCIIEYEYELSSLDIRNLRDWSFQGDLPVLRSVYRLEVPGFFIFQHLLRGSRTLDENSSKEVTRNFYGEETGADGAANRFNFTANCLQYYWAMNNIAGLKPEPFTIAPHEYTTHIECQLIRIDYPSGAVQEIMPSYEKFGAQLMENESFGKIAEPGNFEKRLVEEIAGNITDPKEKANAILQHLQEKVKWDGTAGFYADLPPSKVYEKGAGDAATLNLMLVACLRAAGLQADPVILGTRKYGRPHPVYPNEGKFNFVVAAVDIAGQTLLADATSKGLPLGYLSERCLNGAGYRVSARTPGWVPLQSTASGGQSVLFKLAMEGEVLKGKASIKNTGYSAAKVLEYVNEEGKGAYLQSEMKPLIDWNPIDEVFTQNTAGELSSVAEFSISQDMEAVDVIYFKPVFATELLENPFTAETRTCPLDFPFAKSYNYVLTLALPEGYTVAEMPKDVISNFGNKDIVFQFRCASAGGMLTVVSKLQMKRTAFEADEYPQLRQFYDLIVQKNQEMLVLKKS